MRTAWILATVVTLTGCGGAGAPGDGGALDAPPADGVGARCLVDDDCSDGRFCDGRELCRPLSVDSDGRGCVAATGPACPLDETCDEATATCSGSCADSDGDGHRAVDCGGDDCDDADANRFPGNVETCDGPGRDEDCNPATFGFVDADADGAGSSACCNVQADSTLLCGADCVDADATVGPTEGDGPPLYCDGVDNDCSGTADEGCPCVEGESRECGTDPMVGRVGLCRPGAQICSGGTFGDTCIGGVAPGEEICDGLDNDCDGATDEGVQRTYYADVDGDGYGVPSATLAACSAPPGYTSNPDDCDDARAGVNPAAPEVCNGIDDNCVLGVDEGFTATFYRDADRDGFGDGATSTSACAPPAGYVRNPDDCDDTSASRNPATIEGCDGADNDCDGEVDEGVLRTFYLDADRDGFGLDATTTTACTAPSGYSDRGGDCDDAASARSPAGVEMCNGRDDDCDGVTDPGCTCSDGASRACGPTTEVGECAFGRQLCLGGAWGDCVGAVLVTSEVCNGLDDDCDGDIDDAVTAACYADGDEDGYGIGTLRTVCAAAGGGCPTGFSSRAGDCNDGVATIKPGVTETCDGIDENCSGAADEGTTAAGCRADADADGFGAGVPLTLCRDATRTAFGFCPIGYTSGAGDCDDGAASVRPGAVETCNSVDDDCDGVTDDGVVATPCYVDADGDGRGMGAPTTQCRDAARATFGYCPAAFANLAGDCNDASSAVRPGAVEVCNGTDDDCDGVADDGFSCPAGRTRTGSAAYGSCATAAGVFTCRSDCTGEIFTPTLPAETCNGLDENCNGSADETFTCVRSSTGNPCVTACGLPGARTCSSACNYTGAGATTCRTTGEGAAVPGTCNGCDDDADGTIDDGFACRFGATQTCTTACGTAGTQRCLADCSGFDACRAATETCNACDDDLDGAPDDSLTCVQNLTRPCTFDSNGAAAGCSGIAGEQICNAACSAWGTCGRTTEVCNYVCDDNANGTADDDRDVAYGIGDHVVPGDCASFDCGGACTCVFAGGYNAIRIASSAVTWQVSHTWVRATYNIGYGDFTVSPDIVLEPPAAGQPGEGYAIILSDNTGALWAAQPCGVPYARTGLAVEWRFTPATEQDQITIRRLTGSGTGTVLGTFPVAPGTMYAPNLDDASVGTLQHNLNVIYTPDDPGTVGSEQRLRVTTYAGATLADVSLAALPNLFTPNEPLRIGFTARTTSTTASVYVAHSSVLGDELHIRRARICPGY